MKKILNVYIIIIKFIFFFDMTNSLNNWIDLQLQTNLCILLFHL